MWSRTLAVASMALSFNVCAANLFVAEGGTGLDCSAQDPCGSIQAAVDMAAAYDKIRVRAGTYVENITIPVEKTGLRISGKNAMDTVLVSAGANDVPKEAPPGVAADIIFDIFAAEVTIERFTVKHPEGYMGKRDIGFFVRLPATNVTIQKNIVQRVRSGEPPAPAPGSRGVLVFKATGTNIVKNILDGNYEDHIHLPSSSTTVKKNTVLNATRLGIVIIQENPSTLSIDNVVNGNTVIGSGSDAIQVQGDNNLVRNNILANNAGAGIKLCGPLSEPACVPPGQTASADNNTVSSNYLSNNGMGIVDDGVDNVID